MSARFVTQGRINRIDPVGSPSARENADLSYWLRGACSDLLALLGHKVMRQEATLLDAGYVQARVTATLLREIQLSGGLRPFLDELGIGEQDDWASVARQAVLERGAQTHAWKVLAPWVREAVQDIRLENEWAWQALQGAKGGSDSSGTDWVGGFVPTCDAPKPQHNSHRFLSYAFAIPQGRTLEASVRFHRLPIWSRQVFQAVIWDRKSLRECLSAGFGPEERLLHALRQGLDALLGLEGAWPDLDRLTGLGGKNHVG